MARSCNILLHKVPEQSGLPKDTLHLDKNFVLNALSGCEVSLDNIMVQRLGKLPNTGKPRPLLIRLSSKANARKVMRLSNKLPNNISVSLDRTTLERAELSNLRERMKVHNSDNIQDKLTIDTLEASLL